jgi:hypothetical protein
LFVGGDEVADKDEDGHNDVLSDGNNIRASDFSDSNATICLVGCVQVDVVRTDTCCDCELELLCLGKTFGGEIAWVESAEEKY